LHVARSAAKSATARNRPTAKYEMNGPRSSFGGSQSIACEGEGAARGGGGCQRVSSPVASLEPGSVVTRRVTRELFGNKGRTARSLVEASTQGHGVSADDSAPAPDLQRAHRASREFISVHVVFAGARPSGDNSARPIPCLLVCVKVPFSAWSGV
jgi:hypothetical protein